MACTKNAISEYIDNILTSHTENPSLTILECMQLNSFSLMGTTDEFCIPDCGEFLFVGPYYNNAGQLNLNNISKTYTLPTTCCENYDLLGISINKPFSQVTLKSTICCNTFSDCAITLNNLMQQYLFYNNGIYDVGIHEYDTYNGESTLCLINQKIQTLSTLDKEDFLNAFLVLGGFVLYTEVGNVYAGTTVGFLAFL